MNMNININTTTDELLELWATYSYKLFHKQSATWEDLAVIRAISKVLDSRGIVRLEVFNIEEQKYTLRYYEQGSEYKKVIQVEAEDSR